MRIRSIVLSLLIVMMSCGDVTKLINIKGELQWEEGFSTLELDTSKWSYQRGGWTGSQVQNCYVDDNVTLQDDKLIITAKYEPGYSCFNNQKDYTSGFIQTKGKYTLTYGYIEAKMKLPKSNSTWPAFWMSPDEAIYGPWPRSGEIDIMEAKGHDLSKVYGNAIWGEEGNIHQQKGIAEIDDAAEWHVYALKWTEGRLEYFVDDVSYHVIDNFDNPNATIHPGPFDIPYYIRVNLAVGGSYLEAPWNDAINAIDQLPAVMEVDWIKVYK